MNSSRRSAFSAGLVFLILSSSSLVLSTVSPKGCDAPQPAQRLVAYGSFNYTHRIRTSRPEAQSLFDQGMLLAADFNQPEAAAAFAAALSYDHLCAMCWWGLAHARGPFQNKPAIPPPDNPAAEHARYTHSEMWAAVEAINIAAALTGLALKADAEAAAQAAAAALHNGTAATNATAGGGGAGGTTLRLMERLGRCRPSYGKPGATVGHRRRARRAQEQNSTQSHQSEGRASLSRERHYVAAMADRLSSRAVWGEAWEAAELRYAQDMADIAGCWVDDADAPALAAEALANTSPWDFWDPTTAAPRPATPVVLALLNESLSRDPRQPLALHLHIHVTEGLPPGRGPAKAGLSEPSADSLLGLLPAFDHLQHMPSHTYVRVGRWADAVESNIASLRASVRGSHACLASLYPEHSTAMGVFAASMGADLQRAAVYARVLKELPRFVRDAPASLGFQWGAPLPVWVRFAQWKPILQTPPPPTPGGDGGGAGGGNGTSSGARFPAHEDVAADPALDPVLQYPAGKGPAPTGAGNSSEESGTGVVVTGPGPLRGPLAGTEYSADGSEYARTLWHFARVMAMAAQLAAGQDEGAGAAANSTAPANGTAAPNGTSPAARAGAAALAAKRRELEAEMAALRAAEKAVPPDVPSKPGQGLGIDVPGYQLLALVLRLFAEARFAALGGRLEVAAEKLARAAEVEASGGYFEPPRLGPQPARQCLGWVLLRGGRLREALQTYLEDLSEFPANPWSIRGLHAALAAADGQLGQLKQQLGVAEAEAKAAKQGSSSGGAEAAEGKALQLRGQAEALQSAVDAATAAVAAADGAVSAAAARLQSSCPAFSQHHV